MPFLDVVKQQRLQGGGLMKSLGSAATKTTLEKIDPRNYLFKSGGVFNALFPKVKGYSTKQTSQKIKDSGITGSSFSNEQVTLMVQKLDVIGKNSIVLPSMARDMFVVKQNLIKLVRLQGGTPTTKSADWFSRQLARENAYESKFGNRQSKSTSPTNMGADSQSNQGMFASLLQSLGKSLLGLLIKGGLITGLLVALGKYFQDPEFRKKVNETIDKILTSIFGEDWAKNLITGVSAVIGALVLFKGALKLLELFVIGMVAKLAGKLGLPVPGLPSSRTPAPGAPIPDTDSPEKPSGKKSPPAKSPSAKKPLGVGALGKFGIFSALLGEAYLLYKLIQSDSKENQSMQEAMQDGNWTPEQGFTAEGGKIDTKNIRGLSTIVDEDRDGSIGNAETKKFIRQQGNQPTSSPSQIPQNSGTALTFNQLTKEQQDQFLVNQAKAEGFYNNKNTVAKRHNNPGNIIAKSPTQVFPQQAKFGGVPGETIKGPDGKTRTFVRFPSVEAGFAAQKDLWSRKYGNKPLNQALTQWVDPSSKAEIQNYTTTTLAGITGQPKISGSSLNSETIAMNDNMMRNKNDNNFNTITNNVVQNQQGSKSSSASQTETFDVDLVRLLLSTQS